MSFNCFDKTIEENPLQEVDIKEQNGDKLKEKARLLKNENDSQTSRTNLLSVPLTISSIVGALVGIGPFIFPKAVADTGWLGIPVLIFAGCLSAYSTNLLGKCWNILRERYPEYRYGHVQDIYPVIGFRASGKIGEYSARIVVDVSTFFIGMIYILIIGKNLDRLFEHLVQIKLHSCSWIAIDAVFLSPISWLGTPKNFWFSGILATATSVVSCVLIVIGAIAPAPDLPPALSADFTFYTVTQAFGTIWCLVSFALYLPVMQADMKQPEKIGTVVIVGILGDMVLLLSSSVPCMILMGHNISHSNILDDMTPSWIVYSAYIILTSHLLFAFNTLVNPLFQDLEKLFHVKNEFAWKRCLLRSVTIAVIVFIAMSIPNVGAILALVGGTSLNMGTYILPPLFHYFLSRQSAHGESYGEQSKFATISKWRTFKLSSCQKLMHCTTLIVACVVGVITAYSSMVTLFDGSAGFNVPCYMNWTVAD